jgi:hypothetical protein
MNKRTAENKQLVISTFLAPKVAISQLATLNPAINPAGMAKSTDPKAALFNPSRNCIAGMRDAHVAVRTPEKQKKKMIVHLCLCLAVRNSAPTMPANLAFKYRTYVL